MVWVFFLILFVKYKNADTVDPPNSGNIRIRGCLQSNSIFLAPVGLLCVQLDSAFPLLNCCSEAPWSKLTYMQILTPQLPLCPVSYFPLEIKTLSTERCSHCTWVHTSLYNTEGKDPHRANHRLNFWQEPTVKKEQTGIYTLLWY